jgi:hypothetical protein
MRNPLESSRLKVERAKHHIQDLDVVLMRFRTEHPHEIVIETEPDTGYKLHKFRLCKPAPYAEVSIIIGDTVNNLRAALDHAVYSCAIVAGHAAPRYKTCSFPFGDNESSFNNAVNGRTSVPPEIRACLQRFRAYQGGHVALWALNDMCNRDKHALITPTVMGFEDIRVAFDDAGGGAMSPRNVRWNRANDEVELFRTRTDAKCQLTISVEIVFDGTGLMGGHRIVPILNSLVDVVGHVLMALEAEMVLLFPDAFSELLFRSPR